MSERREVIITKMKRSAITWLASMHSNFYISPWGQMWKRHRVELRGIAIIGTSGFILSTPQKKGVEGKKLKYSSLDLCKRKENALLCPLTSILHGSCYLLSPSLANCLTKFIPKTAEGFYFPLSLNNGILRNWSISAEHILLQYQRTQYFLFLS